ncbi:Protein YLS7 [Linum grandiflorum]
MAIKSGWPKGSASVATAAFPRSLAYITVSVAGLALFLFLASLLLVSSPISSTVQGYFYKVDRLQVIQPNQTENFSDVGKNYPSGGSGLEDRGLNVEDPVINKEEKEESGKKDFGLEIQAPVAGNEPEVESEKKDDSGSNESEKKDSGLEIANTERIEESERLEIQAPVAGEEPEVESEKKDSGSNESEKKDSGSEIANAERIEESERLEIQSPVTDKEQEVESAKKVSGLDIEAPVSDTEQEVESEKKDSGSEIQAPVSDKQQEVESEKKDSGSEVQAPVSDKGPEVESDKKDSGSEIEALVTDKEQEVESEKKDSELESQAPVTDKEQEVESEKKDSELESQAPVADKEQEVESDKKGSGLEIQAPVADKGQEVVSEKKDSELEIQAPVTDKGQEVESDKKDSGSEIQAPVTDKGREVESDKKDSGLEIQAPVGDKGPEVESEKKDSGSKIQAPVTDKGQEVESDKKDSGLEIQAPVSDKGQEVESDKKDSGVKIQPVTNKGRKEEPGKKGDPESNLQAPVTDKEQIVESEKKGPELNLQVPVINKGRKEEPGKKNGPVSSAMQDVGRQSSPSVEKEVDKGANDGGTSSVPSAADPAIKSAEDISVEASQKTTTRSDDLGCDLFKGSWFYDPRGPSYKNNSCPVITQMQNCQGNGRPDREYESWRWKPSQCDLPRFDGKKFLELMRGKTIAFIGDSVARNHMESLLCLLWQVEVPKNRGNKRMHRYYFRSTSTMIVRMWSSWLVHQTPEAIDFAPEGVTKVHLDAPDENFMQFVPTFDVVVLSSGHWFAKQSVYVLNNEIVGGQLWWPDKSRVPKINNIEAFGISVETIVASMLTHPNYTGLTILRSYSPDHYEGGAWNTGGSCTGKTRPLEPGQMVRNEYVNIMHEKQVTGYHRGVKRATNKSKIKLMDVTEVFSYRHDGHPGPYRSPDPNKRTQYGPDGKPPPQDCLHWCMPGPIDTWNELVLEIIKQEYEAKKS